MVATRKRARKGSSRRGSVSSARKKKAKTSDDLSAEVQYVLALKPHSEPADYSISNISEADFDRVKRLKVKLSQEMDKLYKKEFDLYTAPALRQCRDIISAAKVKPGKKKPQKALLNFIEKDLQKGLEKPRLQEITKETMDSIKHIPTRKILELIMSDIGYEYERIRQGPTKDDAEKVQRICQKKLKEMTS